MVNFDDTNTLMRNKKEIQEIVTMQRRYQVINALRDYKRRDYKGQDLDISLPDLQSELIALFYEIDSTIEKDLLKKSKDNPYAQITQIEEDINSGEEEKVFKAWNYINRLLYNLQLTKLDVKKEIDWTDPEEVNEENEL